MFFFLKNSQRKDRSEDFFFDKGLWIEAESSDTVFQQLLVFKNIFSCTFDVPAEEHAFT